ncbi:hypothetical protein PSI23_18880 [Xenorhabdus sp. XENO-10]|uniref:Uncharacterized protein n=1 Tax=Xenorhabdus yunnanensis TaxID=3025878 RepID=A0ABT5LJK2_9GAMM|nr:hypothetical protein [Xenorhabdus yunnanensis]MDC9591295.1 hypothetical protein [Xenorhabdus yunnanensis]
MAKKDIDIDKLLSIDVCPLCGKKDCEYNKKENALVINATKQIIKTYVTKGKKQAAIRYAGSLGMLAKQSSDYLRNIHKATETDNSMSTISLFNHYVKNTGEPLTTHQVGIHDRIRSLMQKPSAFKRPSGSIQSRFISQIQNGERINFRNAYDFGIESRNVNDALWSVGGAVVSGNLDNVRIEPRGNNYNISGEINYHLYDKYSDTVDIFNWFEAPIDPFKPFEITGEWKEPVNFDIDKHTYETKVKPMLDQQKK